MGVNDFINIGDKIKQLRKEKEISQKKMAGLLGINVSTYSNYENGFREPSKEIIEKIAEKLEVSPWYLMGGEITATVQRQASALDGLIAILTDMYGYAAMKWIDDESNRDCYLLIGEGEKQVVLNEFVIDKLLDITKNSIQNAIDLMKGSKWEEEISNDVLTKLNNAAPVKFSKL